MSAGLNARQQEAVLFGDGPLLVLAGAGAGKTRVLTQRVAHLVEHRQISPSRILVVTFTNKAAKEMKTRLEGLIGAPRVQKLWIGTFHAVCARLLRQEIERLHYSRRFVIYDTDDQEKLMKQVMAQLELDPTQHKPRSVLRRISALKTRGCCRLTTAAKPMSLRTSGSPGFMMPIRKCWRVTTPWILTICCC